AQRYAVYKKLSSCKDFNALQEVKEELVDRYGKIPMPVQRLLELFQMRLMAKKVGITSLSISKGYMTIELPPDEKLIPNVLSLVTTFPEYLTLNPRKTNCLILKWTEEEEGIGFLKEVLRELGDC
ncbi:MAG: TRCF domain-containing protein, partial [bacterium]